MVQREMMLVRLTGPVAMMLGVLVFTGCARTASTARPASTVAEATAAPSATLKPAAKKTAPTPLGKTRTAAPIKASQTAVPKVATSPRPRATITASAPKTTKTAAPKAASTPTAKATVAATAEPTRSPTPSAPSVVGDVANGRQLFLQHCSNCHGANAQGGIGPSLEDEASRKNLAQTIAWIKNPESPMPKLYPGTINSKDVLDIATYLQSLK
ncbi:MAG: c-type cytochrome [Vulcanimicrobiaceae bacterium]